MEGSTLSWGIGIEQIVNKCVFISNKDISDNRISAQPPIQKGLRIYGE